MKIEGSRLAAARYTKTGSPGGRRSRYRPAMGDENELASTHCVDGCVISGDGDEAARQARGRTLVSKFCKHRVRIGCDRDVTDVSAHDADPTGIAGSADLLAECERLNALLRASAPHLRKEWPGPNSPRRNFSVPTRCVCAE